MEIRLYSALICSIHCSYMKYRHFHVERKHTHALSAKVPPALPSFPGKAFIRGKIFISGPLSTGKNSPRRVARLRHVTFHRETYNFLLKATYPAKRVNLVNRGTCLHINRPYDNGDILAGLRTVLHILGLRSKMAALYRSIASLYSSCSYEPGLVGSSPEWDELFLCSYDCFCPS